MYENISLAHFKLNQYSDSLRPLLKALRLNPSIAHTWFNLSLVLADYAKLLMTKDHKSVKDVELSITILDGALRGFAFLKSVQHHDTIADCHPELKYEVTSASARERYAKVQLYIYIVPENIYI